MVEYNSIETPNIQPSLNDQQQFRQIKLMKLKIIVAEIVADIKERVLMSKRLSKSIASFECIDKS